MHDGLKNQFETICKPCTHVNSQETQAVRVLLLQRLQIYENASKRLVCLDDVICVYEPKHILRIQIHAIVLVCAAARQTL
jgi:hypothetical protein